MAKKKNYKPTNGRGNRKLPRICSCPLKARVLEGAISKHSKEWLEEANLITDGYLIKKVNRAHGKVL